MYYLILACPGSSIIVIVVILSIVITTELIAIYKACSLCVMNPSLLGKSIVIVSDSLVAVNWINSDNFKSLEHI